MNTFLLGFALFVFAIIGMAIGVIVKNKSLQGSCGGLNNIDGLQGACDLCETRQQCKQRLKSPAERR